MVQLEVDTREEQVEVVQADCHEGKRRDDMIHDFTRRIAMHNDELMEEQMHILDKTIIMRIPRTAM